MIIFAVDFIFKSIPTLVQKLGSKIMIFFQCNSIIRFITHSTKVSEKGPNIINRVYKNSVANQQKLGIKGF